MKSESTKQQIRNFLQEAVDDFKNPDSIRAKAKALKVVRKKKKEKTYKKFGL